MGTLSQLCLFSEKELGDLVKKPDPWQIFLTATARQTDLEKPPKKEKNPHRGKKRKKP